MVCPVCHPIWKTVLLIYLHVDAKIKKKEIEIDKITYKTFCVSFILPSQFNFSLPAILVENIVCVDWVIIYFQQNLKCKTKELTIFLCRVKSQLYHL